MIKYESSPNRCHACGSGHLIQGVRGLQCNHCGESKKKSEHKEKKQKFSFDGKDFDSFKEVMKYKADLVDVEISKKGQNIKHSDILDELLLVHEEGVLSPSNNHLFNPIRNTMPEGIIVDELFEVTPDMIIKDVISFRCDDEECLARMSVNTAKNPKANKHVTPCLRCGGIMFRGEIYD